MTCQVRLNVSVWIHTLIHPLILYSISFNIKVFLENVWISCCHHVFVIANIQRSVLELAIPWYNRDVYCLFSPCFDFTDLLWILIVVGSEDSSMNPRRLRLVAGVLYKWGCLSNVITVPSSSSLRIPWTEPIIIFFNKLANINQVCNLCSLLLWYSVW